MATPGSFEIPHLPRARQRIMFGQRGSMAKVPGVRLEGMVSAAARTDLGSSRAVAAPGSPGPDATLRAALRSREPEADARVSTVVRRARRLSPGLQKR